MDELDLLMLEQAREEHVHSNGSQPADYHVRAVDGHVRIYNYTAQFTWVQQ